MSWEHATIQQIVSMVTPSSLDREHRRHNSSRPSGDRFGVCPCCRAFVQIGEAEIDGAADECPACHAIVGELGSLWPDDPGLR